MKKPYHTLIVFFIGLLSLSINNCFAQGYTINTIAGSGDNGYSGNGGTATSTELYYLSNVAVDTSGNIYITENQENVIRKIDIATGNISTIAGNGLIGFSGDGGPATAAKLNYPQGIAIDTHGNIYIADTHNNRIRKINATTGVITTIAGNGTPSYYGDGGQAINADLYGPSGIAVDTAGNIFIVDSYNNVIRKVDANTGIITTIVGNGTFGFSGDGGQATSAELSYPQSMAFDAQGNIYIADYNNERIRKVNITTGIITTVAGNGLTAYSGDGGQATAAELNSPAGITLDAQGNIYIADLGNNCIRKVNASTGVITTIAGDGTPGYKGDGGIASASELYTPKGIAIDKQGDIYISDQGNNRIRKIDAASDNISTIAGGGTNGLGDGAAATAAELYFPNGIAVDAQQNIYIADKYNNRIRKVDAATGTITTIAGNGIRGYSGDGGPATSAELYYPQGIAVDTQGNVYIADYWNQRIRKIDGTTGIITTFAGGGTNGTTDSVPATTASLSYPEGVAVDSQDNVYISDTYHNIIRKVNISTGIIATVAGNGTQGFSGDNGPATMAELSAPDKITIDTQGNIYIATHFRIRKVDAATGIITTIAGNGTNGSYSGDGGPATAAALYLPQSVAVNPQGDVLIADTYNNAIRKIDTATGIISTIAGTGSIGWYGNGYYSGDGGPATQAELYKPFDITTDAQGNVYVADSYNNRIRKLIQSAGISKLTDIHQNITIYPNPTTSILNIKFNRTQKNILAVIKIYNTIGQEVLKKQVEIVNNSTIPINVHKLSPGIYLLHIITNDHFQNIKFVRQ